MKVTSKLIKNLTFLNEFEISKKIKSLKFSSLVDLKNSQLLTLNTADCFISEAKAELKTLNKIKINHNNDFYELVTSKSLMDEKINNFCKNDKGEVNFKLQDQIKMLADNKKIENIDKWLEPIRKVRREEFRVPIAKKLNSIVNNPKIQTKEDAESIFIHCLSKNHKSISVEKLHAVSILLEIDKVKTANDVNVFMITSIDKKNYFSKNIFDFIVNLLKHKKNKSNEHGPIFKIVNSCINNEGRINNYIYTTFNEILNNKKIKDFKDFLKLRKCCLNEELLIDQYVLRNVNTYLKSKKIKSSREVNALLINYNESKNTNLIDYHEYVKELLKNGELDGDEILSAMRCCQDKNHQIDFQLFKAISRTLNSKNEADEKIMPDDIFFILDTLSGDKVINHNGTNSSDFYKNINLQRN